VCCAAALAEVNELLDRDLAGNAKEVGAYFMEKLNTLPHVKEVRGQGLLVGVEFDDTISGVDVKHEYGRNGLWQEAGVCWAQYSA
ncbi:MAG: aminotransferase class III-fold pyridoxal phosphate-dependent enzyme, partial [Oliverpabstia sp.]|nr:aminotransferase class III-fold pyridoxal phosphate-dependent enzyme [Oliverpabstia sp.]